MSRGHPEVPRFDNEVGGAVEGVSHPALTAPPPAPNFNIVADQNYMAACEGTSSFHASLQRLGPDCATGNTLWLVRQLQRVSGDPAAVGVAAGPAGFPLSG